MGAFTGNVTDQVVDLRVWRVAGAANIARAFGHMAGDRRGLRRQQGLTFNKLLGTGSGRTFTMRDADVHHWALLTVFTGLAPAVAFENSRILDTWQRIAAETLRVRMRPLSTRGRWSGQEPFDPGTPARWDGPVAALTRARIRPSKFATFWSSVPPVALDLNSRPGLLASMGIGEAPVGLQGTFSVWASGKALTAFAQRGAAHRQVIAETHRRQWYGEELFARFAVLDATGTLQGEPLAIPTPARER